MTPKQLEEIEKICAGMDNPANWQSASDKGRLAPIDVFLNKLFPNGTIHLSDFSAYAVCRAILL